jgi:hypothetical protein
MLGRGASLREIGEVLRHRKAGTTQIYAKVDFRALRDLAQPWPGGARWRSPNRSGAVHRTSTGPWIQVAQTQTTADRIPRTSRREKRGSYHHQAGRRLGDRVVERS